MGHGRKIPSLRNGPLRPEHRKTRRDAGSAAKCQLQTFGEPALTSALNPSQSSSLGDCSCSKRTSAITAKIGAAADNDRLSHAERSCDAASHSFNSDLNVEAHPLVLFATLLLPQVRRIRRKS
jgi:hypothetical protein